MYLTRRSKKRLSKPKDKIAVFVLAVALVLSFAMPVMAQRDILTTTQSNINDTEIWWDNLWESTFNPAPYTISNSPAPLDVPALPTGGSGSLPPPPPVGGSGSSGSINVPTLPPVGDSGVVGSAVEIQNTNNLSLYAFVNPTRFILGIGLIAWLFSFGFKMVESKTVAQSTHTFIKLFVPVFLALLFLANQATYSRVLAYGMRDIVNSWSEGVMNLQIADFSVREALQDGLITQDAKELMAKKYLACQSMEKPEVTIPSLIRPDTSDPNVPPITPAQRKVYDYLECLDELSTYAQEKLDAADAEKECSGKICKAYKSFLDLFLGVSAGEAFVESQKRLAGDSPDGASLEKLEKYNNILSNRQYLWDFALGKTEESEAFIASLTQPSKSFLYFTQWMWISTLEMAMFLLALFAPIFIALSVVPGKQNMFNVWLIEFLTVGLAKMAYTVVIGIVAVQLASSDTGFLDDTFFMTLGIFAPAVSFAVVVSGGIAAASSFKSQSAGVAAIAAGTLSSGAATIAYSMSRAYDKRR